MALDGCGLVCKYVLIVFNLIFALVGFACLVLGLLLRFSASTRGFFDAEQLTTAAFVTGVTVLIVLGAVMLIVVVFGDYGACNEKRCALQTFSVLVSILALAEVVVGVLAYSKSDKIGQSVVEFYSSMYALYLNSGDPGMGITLTFIHKAFHCCGLTGVPPLELATHTCPKPQGFMENLIMPNCPKVISDAFNTNGPLVMGTFIGTGALLIAALVCAAVLLTQIKRGQAAINTYYSSVY